MKLQRETIKAQLKAQGVKMYVYKYINNLAPHFVILKNGVVVQEWTGFNLKWFMHDGDPSLVGQTEKEIKGYGFKPATIAWLNHYSARLASVCNQACGCTDTERCPQAEQMIKECCDLSEKMMSARTKTEYYRDQYLEVESKLQQHFAEG